jgi:thiamine kinase-like enzyme
VILTGSNIAHYLVDRGLMTHESVVDGDFLVVQVPRRNQNFKVVRQDAPSYFVKQVRDGTPDAIASLSCEARCYQVAQENPDLHSLAELVPKYRVYDAENNVLVVDLIPNSENLREHADRTGEFSNDIARRLGVLLGSYHSTATLEITRTETAFPSRKPWILSFHTQDFPAGSISSGVAELQGTLRSYPEYMRELDVVSSTWQTDSLIHGDIKWDNCLTYAAGDVPSNHVKIVDWELASRGDACWDIGAILQSYLTSWVLSMPDNSALPSDALMQQARFRLDRMYSAISAFWSSYSSTRGFTEQRARGMLERSMAHGAARMVQTVFEIANYSGVMSSVAARVLQLSYNILQDPGEALDTLLAA